MPNNDTKNTVSLQQNSINNGGVSPQTIIHSTIPQYANCSIHIAYSLYRYYYSLCVSA